MNGPNISGAASTTYSFTPTLSQSGYQYQAVFTNSAGTATTTVATLTVRALWITSVSPNPVTGSTKAQMLTINGSNFASKATLMLRDLTAGKTLANLKPTTANSSGTQLSVSATFGIAADSWSVEAVNPNGPNSGQFPFQVVAPAAPTPTCRLTVSPTSISSGQSATLTWTSTNATGGVIDNGIGSVGVSGSQIIKVSTFETIKLQDIATFTGTFKGPGGDATCEANLAIGINIVVEMATLAKDAYAENTDAPVSRNWRPIKAQELNISSGMDTPGVYTLPIVWGKALALVLYGIVDNRKTLAISFEGTNLKADPGQVAFYMSFSDYYSLFVPMYRLLGSYIKANGIQQVFVTGHSLGVAMVQDFMAHVLDGTIPGININIVSGYTWGSPGADKSPTIGPLVNFKNVDDPIPSLGFTVGHYKSSGVDIVIHSPIVPVDLTFPSGHQMPNYLIDTQNLVNRAVDSMAAPSNKVDAQALISGDFSKSGGF